MKKMTFGELRQALTKYNETKHDHDILGYIVFKESNWPDDDYSLESRTYAVSSDNKAFRVNMGGFSIFGDALDGSDPGVRLDWYISKLGGDWEIDYCYMEDEEE